MVISNIETCAFLKISFSLASALIIVFFALSCRSFFLMYSHSFFVTSVRGSGLSPITAASAALGVRAFMNAALGVRFLAGAFFAGALAAAFFAGAALVTGFFGATAFFAGAFLAGAFFAGAFFAVAMCDLSIGVRMQYRAPMWSCRPSCKAEFRCTMLMPAQGAEKRFRGTGCHSPTRERVFRAAELCCAA